MILFTVIYIFLTPFDFFHFTELKIDGPISFQLPAELQRGKERREDSDMKFYQH